MKKICKNLFFFFAFFIVFELIINTAHATIEITPTEGPDRAVAITDLKILDSGGNPTTQVTLGQSYTVQVSLDDRLYNNTSDTANLRYNQHISVLAFSNTQSIPSGEESIAFCTNYIEANINQTLFPVAIYLRGSSSTISQSFTLQGGTGIQDNRTLLAVLVDRDWGDNLSCGDVDTSHEGADARYDNQVIDYKTLNFTQIHPTDTDGTGTSETIPKPTSPHTPSGWVPSDPQLNTLQGVILYNIEKIIRMVLLPYGGIVAFLVILYGGILYMTAGSNEEQSQRAKKVIIGAIIGIAVIALSYAIVLFLKTDIFNQT
jgi:hypothetical protein